MYVYVCMYVCMYIYIYIYKGTAVPLQAQRVLGSQGSQISWQRHRMVVGCQPYAPAAFTPRKYSWYSFLLEAESTPGPYCDQKDFMSMKNPLTPAGIEPATFRFAALCYRRPHIYIYIYIYTYVHTFLIGLFLP